MTSIKTLPRQWIAWRKTATNGNLAHQLHSIDDNSTMNRKTDAIGQYLIPLLFGLVALACYLWGLDAKSLWGDEASTAWHSTYSATALWTQPITHKPPLYYLLTAAFWSPGDSEFALRLPAALLGALTVALAWVLGNQLAGRSTAFWLALFMLLSDIHLHYSQEARHYVLLTFGWLLLILAMVKLLRDDTGRSSIGILLLWALGALLMVHAHPVGLPWLAASQLAYWIALAVVRPLPWRRMLLPALLSLGAALTLLPWLGLALENAAASFNWLRQPSPMQALLQWLSLFGARSLVHLGGRELAVTGSILLAAVSLAGIATYLRQRRSLGILLLGLVLLPPMTLWLIGLVKPVYLTRTISPDHLLAMTGLALAIGHIKWPRLRVVAGITLALLLGASSWAWRTHYQKEAWRDLSSQLGQRAARSDIVLLCENQLYRPLWFYLGEQTPRLLYLDRRRHRLYEWQPDNRQWRPFRPAPGERPPVTFWLVDRLGHCPQGIDRMLYRFTGLRYRHGEPWRGHALSLTPWQQTR